MPDSYDDDIDNAVPAAFQSACSHVDLLLPDIAIKQLIDFGLEDGLFWQDLIVKILLGYVNERRKKEKRIFK